MSTKKTQHGYIDGARSFSYIILIMLHNNAIVLDALMANFDCTLKVYYPPYCYLNCLLAVLNTDQRIY